MSTPPRIRIVPDLTPKTTSNDPDTFEPDFSIRHELRTNLSAYIISPNEGQQISITKYPIECVGAVRTLRHDTAASTRAAITCAFVGGYNHLYSHPAVSMLRAKYDQVSNLDANIPGHILETLINQSSTFSLPLPSRGSRVNIHVDVSMGDRFNTWCDETGMAKSDLAKLCIMASLRDQPRVNKDHRKRMDQIVEIFLVQCEVRHNSVTDLIGRLKVKYAD